MEKSEIKKIFPLATVLLIAANISVFLFFGFDLPQDVADKYGLIPLNIIQGKNLQTLIAYMFLHKNIWHLLFNTITLVSFGYYLEEFIGTKKFFAVYLLAGIAGGLAQTFLYPDSIIPLVGASGAIFGLIGTIALLEPKLNVYIFFLIPLPIILFVVGYIFIATYLMEIGLTFGISHAAHLGGMLAGAFTAFFIDLRKALKGIGYAGLAIAVLVAIIYLVPTFVPSLTQIIKQPRITHSYDISILNSNSTHSTYNVNVSVANEGFGTAKNVIVWIGFDTVEEGTVWKQAKSEEYDIEPNYLLMIPFIVDIKRNVTTRLHIAVWGNNFPTQESFSNWFNT